MSTATSDAVTERRTDRFSVFRRSYSYYLANKAVDANSDLEVKDKFTGDIATRAAKANQKTIDEAIARSVDGHSS